MSKKRAARLNAEAMALDDDVLAEKKYLEALRLDPKRADTLYNLGLIYKYRALWEKSLKCNRKAFRLDPDHEAACWNLGIAATALRRWADARQAWIDFGVSLPRGDEPIFLEIGQTPIRINPSDHPEVVWADRLCPARAQLKNIPLPRSGHGYDDVVLHDGAPNGERVSDGRRYPVFDELELFEVSAFSTFEAEAAAPDENAVDALIDLSREHGAMVEDWTHSVRMICKKCSEGVPHEHHDPAPGEDWDESRLIGVAAKDEPGARALLGAWRDQGLGEFRHLELSLARNMRHH